MSKYRIRKINSHRFVIDEEIEKAFFKKRKEWEIKCQYFLNIPMPFSFVTQEEAEEFLNTLTNGYEVVKEVEVKDNA